MIEIFEAEPSSFVLDLYRWVRNMWPHSEPTLQHEPVEPFDFEVVFLHRSPDRPGGPTHLIHREEDNVMEVWVYGSNGAIAQGVKYFDADEPDLHGKIRWLVDSQYSRRSVIHRLHASNQPRRVHQRRGCDHRVYRG